MSDVELTTMSPLSIATPVSRASRAPTTRRYSSKYTGSPSPSMPGAFTSLPDAVTDSHP